MLFGQPVPLLNDSVPVLPGPPLVVARQVQHRSSLLYCSPFNHNPFISFTLLFPGSLFQLGPPCQIISEVELPLRIKMGMDLPSIFFMFLQTFPEGVSQFMLELQFDLKPGEVSLLLTVLS
jgi:hypothetical protein